MHSPIGRRDALLSLLIPGFVFRAFGHPRVAKYAMRGLGVALFIYFAWLGHAVATIAFSAILSLHVMSVLFFLHRYAPGLNFVFRILSTLLILVFLNNVVYGSLQNKLEQVLMPLRVKNNVVVVKTWGTRNLKRGDWIAYRINQSSGALNGANYHGNIITEQGFGLEPLMAVPGDIVRFGKTDFSINGKSFSTKPYMPTNGEVVLSEKQWLVWPEFTMRGNGVPQADIARFLQRYSVISENEIVGKPFGRWFGRKQILK